MGKLKILVLAVLLAGSGVAGAADIVAKLDLRFLKETDQVVSVMCFGEAEEDCTPWAHGYLFEARVRKVLHGELREKKFLVIYGHHAMYKRDIAGVIGIMSKLTDGLDGAEYQVVDVAYSGNLACFNWWGGNDEIDGEFPASGTLMRCFDRDDTRNLPPSQEPPEEGIAEKSLRATHQAYHQALVAGDVRKLEGILGKEFVYTSSSGEAVDRAAQLELLGSGTLDIEGDVGSDEQIHIYGNTGIVSSRFDATGKRNGQSFNSTERHTSVWLIRGGRWQLVSEQATLVARPTAH